ncbi:hypothetical protein DFH08DRAFT_401539 [Mycena albidolilacea]|uniref:Uncharacterized protein n=1 Tax=Mycena albidolilacea TaxID=1033008 RepID=A0AAD6ZD01_9AGAR|nr:hypothetical protein DFH08DRAFT_401539 [Mycena albidolilacea]
MGALRSTRGLSGLDGGSDKSVTENLRRSLPRWHTKDTQHRGHKNERQPPYSRGPNIAAIVSVDVVAWILAVSIFCVSRDVHASKSGLAVRRKKTSRPSAARRPNLSIGSCTMYHLVISTFRELPLAHHHLLLSLAQRQRMKFLGTSFDGLLSPPARFRSFSTVRSCGEISFLRRRLRSSTTQK